MARVVRRRTASPAAEEKPPCSQCGMPSQSRYVSRWALSPIDMCEPCEERHAETLRKGDYKKV